MNMSREYRGLISSLTGIKPFVPPVPDFQKGPVSDWEIQLSTNYTGPCGRCYFNTSGHNHGARDHHTTRRGDSPSPPSGCWNRKYRKTR